ncbi:MAG: pyruvate formate-lyase [Clostridia bacterium]|nr:pyruvate formate-lyase [Clostridia bacterium]
MNQELYQYYIVDRAHRALRKPLGRDLGAEFASAGLCPEERMCRRFEIACAAETPAIMPFEKIVMRRSISALPDVFTEEEWETIKKDPYIHELGYVSNLSPNYEKIICKGLLAVYEESSKYQKRVIDALLGLCDRYRAEAEKQGREDLAEIFGRVPRQGARNFREALQFFRILHFFLWLEGNYHNTVGRFDQYMYPYFKQDMDAGIYTRETALELLEDFFVSFNKDSDLYVGVQQGDNGQSMVLGGLTPDGTDGFNLLSELCLEASCELKVIDPKINLRVSKNTPLWVYEKGTELTKAGLGFPQYSNDDVVIKGLERLGYDHEDAVNYVVAACWEFIIPGCGNDIPNISGVNFPLLVDRAIRAYLPTGGDFEGLIEETRKNIHAECERKIPLFKNVWFVPSHLMDLLRDGKKYNNFGFHGCGIASAADALAAVKTYVYDEKSVSAERLISALDANFENDPELLHLLRYEAPKMGCGKAVADDLGFWILDTFADALDGKTNDMGGIFRAGTGTAMNYLLHARKVGATADGRRAGEAYGTNFSPSLFAPVPGPLTDIESFTAHDLTRTMNGGPLTLEFDGSVFQNPDTIRKVAMLVKHFIDRGGHQLQLNTVDLDALKEAQKDPEGYRQLVVRIWGWSAYFVELDKEYQDHVMARQMYSV